MNQPLQIDRRRFQVAAATGDDAMAAVRERAQAVHTDSELLLAIFGDGPARDGTWTVVADYWRRPSVGAT